jgi:hypothetical protein
LAAPGGPAAFWGAEKDGLARAGGQGGKRRRRPASVGDRAGRESGRGKSCERSGSAPKRPRNGFRRASRRDTDWTQRG